MNQDDPMTIFVILFGIGTIIVFIVNLKKARGDRSSGPGWSGDTPVSGDDQPHHEHHHGVSAHHDGNDFDGGGHH